jgi:hypothetical protein
MSVNFSSRIVRGAKRALAALAILALLCLATPSASAALDVQFKATDVNGAVSTPSTDLGPGGSSGTVVLGSFTYSVTSIPSDSATSSSLTTITVVITNTSAAINTLDLFTSATGYTALGTTGSTLFVNYSVSGTSHAATVGPDMTISSSSADKNNVLYATTTPLGPLAGVPHTSTSVAIPTTAYDFASSGISAVNSFVRLATPFSLSQALAITLGVGDTAQFTVTTAASLQPQNLTPEPSSLAIAGIGALGLIGFGLRRRKALGA